MIDNTFFIGKVLITLDSVDSSNNYALELLQTKCPTEGTLVYAKEQTMGRGQRGNVWISHANKNITISIILYPKFLQVTNHFFLSKVIALAVQKLVALLVNKPVFIKWPNDIYVENKKIGGILIENSIQGAYMGWSVVGIGLNVNQIVFNDLQKNITSLCLETGQEYAILSLIKQLCVFIEEFYLLLKYDRLAEIHELYMLVLYKYEVWCSFETNVLGLITAKIIEVLPSGELGLLLSDGKKQYFGFKEIRFL